MSTRLLLGPAGSGKTRRCLQEIRAELLANPEGPPLLLLAPKQATFQLERQVLQEPAEDGVSLAGYSRLQILSFDRLARFILESFHSTAPRLLSEEGRLMLLRALLARNQSRLSVFRSAARLPGFAQQLSQVLRELQRHQVGPRRFARIQTDPEATASLRAKLQDLTLIMQGYDEALSRKHLEDADRLPDLATATLRAVLRSDTPKFGGLWLDGFAEMTAQELDLVATLIPHCHHATLAFCVEGHAMDSPSWLSNWALVSQTVRACQQRLGNLPDSSVEIVNLPRRHLDGRFHACPALKHLEEAWVSGAVFPDPPFGLELIQTDNHDEEATVAARTILDFVRAGGRYRDIAVLVRDLRTHAVCLRRAFTRFEIPFFLDQREPVAHHPLAELTRSALRVVAFGWQAEDWFGALKSGLVHPNESDIDELENEALARGWKGNAWLEPLPTGMEVAASPTLGSLEECPPRSDPIEAGTTDLGGPHPQASSVQPSDCPAETGKLSLERLRLIIVPPFATFAASLRNDSNQFAPSGTQLVNAIRKLWEDVGVADTLSRWAESDTNNTPAARSHLTVWQLMQDWTDNLALAFADDVMPLRDWLPVLEAGLASLTVGVIPPSLDQVLIGAVDRSRNPELRRVIVLGLNEGHFPAPPPPPTMLTESESMVLEKHGILLGARTRLRVAHERYYGYIALTRASEHITLTCATADDEGRPLNPSPFVSQLQRMFPRLELQRVEATTDWRQARHLHELGAAWLHPGSVLSLADRDDQGHLPADSPFAALENQLSPLRSFPVPDTLTPALAERLFGNPLRTSVSSLEQFAMCPFRFFVRTGLKAEERVLFEIDPRALGNFQHEVLCAFHNQLRAENLRWRDVSADDAKARIAALAEWVARDLSGGLFDADARNRFSRRALTEALQEFVATLIAWMPQYEFDPAEVELAFGMDAGLPPWTLPLDDRRQLAFRGRIDRIDLGPALPDGSRWVVVHDYKSSGRQFDPLLLANGVQLQLPAYLAALRGIPDAALRLGVPSLRPAGVFYANLRGDSKAVAQRDDALRDPVAARHRAYRHTGRFDLAALDALDNRGVHKGDQFNFEIRQDGQLHRRSKDPLPTAQFQSLLDQVETQLRRLGRAVLDGQATVDPYVKGRDRPCDQCDFAAICRIDPWTHHYRALSPTQA